MIDESFVDLSKLVLDKSLEGGARSHKTDQFIISLKSLVPSREAVEVSINYERYGKELYLWKYYRKSSNPVLDNLVDDFKEEAYFGLYDDSLFYRQFPLIISNGLYENLRREVLKNTLYTTARLENILESLLNTSLFYLVLNKYGDIRERLKEIVMDFKYDEFMEDFRQCFRLGQDSCGKKYRIDFELIKIEAINILNGLPSTSLKLFQKFYTSFEANEDLERELILENMILSLEGDCDQLENPYFRDLGNYLYRLRRGQISPEALGLGEYVLPDIFQFKKGDHFYHSLLNKSYVVDRQVVGSYDCIRLKTKSGIYDFKKPII